MKPGQARRRLGKTVYFVSGGQLTAVKLVSVSDDGLRAEVLVGGVLTLELDVRLLMP